MNSNSILTSNLLDIIFENRNKEYGAYVLRRDYNKRLLKSLLGMFGVVLMVAALQMQKSKLQMVKLIQPTFTVTKILPPPTIIKPVVINHNAMAQTKHASNPNTPPVIVADDRLKKIPPTNLQLLTSVPGEYIDGPPSDGPTDRPGPKDLPGIKVAKPVVPVSKEKEIEKSPEIPAQYPGGINEFIKFLKRNLRSPQDLEEDAVITVNVRFIVSLNGDLLGFNVIQTGGEVFDNEVIRVLKKMPKWIPGKSNGENVSSYYNIPVKFTSEK